MTFESDSRPLRVAVVGVGALGRHHAAKLSAIDGASLVAVADTCATQAAQVARDNQCESFTDFTALYDRVDAVSIAVPTVAHLAIASEFLRRGIAVFVEKPIAASLDEARQLVKCEDEHNAPLQVGHIERFNPATAVAWHHSGNPKYIRAERVSPYTFRSTDIGVVHDLMIHDIDLILDLVRAPVTQVSAFGVSIAGRHEDSVQARLTFDNGCIADVTASRMCPGAHRQMQIWSMSGCVSVDFTSREVTSFSPSDALLYGKPLVERAADPECDLEQLKSQVFGHFIRMEKPPVEPGDALEAELTAFVTCVRTRTAPLVGGAEALAAMQVAERVLDVVAEHQWDGHAAGLVGPFARRSETQRRAG